ncbi:MAG: hypothetical protein GVY32_02290 [Gammaproteobacteria bacterium]|jgi:hypothetical protein|nr:hypothetical protein [Gammaproteobacteria bacterium]
MRGNDQFGTFEFKKWLVGSVAWACLWVSGVVGSAHAQVELDSVSSPGGGVERQLQSAFNAELDPVVAVPALSEQNLARLDALRAREERSGGRELVGMLKPTSESFRVVLGPAGESIATPEGPNAERFNVERGDSHVSMAFNVEAASDVVFRLKLGALENADGLLATVSPQAGGGDSVRFVADRMDELLLPTVIGPLVTVRLSVPHEAYKEGAFSFEISNAMVQDPRKIAPECEPGVEGWTDCAVSAACVDFSSDPVDPRDAVARINWESGGLTYRCTGTLVNQVNFNFQHLLTAAHCLNTQAEASTLEAHFDYIPDDCGGAAPPLWELPSTVGADLLRTNSGNDMTYLNLHGPAPAGVNSYLGWTTADIGGGQYRRVSHPSGQPMHYSSSVNWIVPLICGSLPTSQFWYTERTAGSTTDGSSGSALMDSQTRIVGQLYGNCHQESWDECSASTFRYVDGRFNVTYPHIEPWLQRAGASTLVLDQPLGGQSNAPSPLRMKYYDFSPSGSFGTIYRFLVTGAENVDLYVNRNGYYPTTTDWSCRDVGNTSVKRCTLTGGFQYRIGLYARGAYSNATLSVLEVTDDMYHDRFQLFPELPSDVGDFSILPAVQGGEPFVYYASVTEDIEGIRGFRFDGSVSGISSGSTWASDMKLTVTSPDGHEFSVGGYSNVVNDWAFQGGASSSDGTYSSEHRQDAAGNPIFGASGTGSFGIWTLEFEHDWNSENAAQMDWSDVTFTLLTSPD